MKILLIVFMLFLIGCAGLVTYKRGMDHYIGMLITSRLGSTLKKSVKYKEYDEYIRKHTSPFSKTQGVCTTIFKVRKSDNIIVSWRSEGKKSDCVQRSAYD